MSKVTAQYNELTAIIDRYIEDDGVQGTAVPSLFFMRRSDASEPTHGVYKPSFCLVAQGEKEVWLAKDHYTYSPADYLVASVHLPVTTQDTDATPEVPYLGLRLEFTPSQILKVLHDSKLQSAPIESPKRAMFVSHIEPSLMNAVIRLTRLLDHPEDIPMLAPLYTEEILYKVLQGPNGDILKGIVMEESSIRQIREVIEHIMNHFNRSVRIEELAEIAKMSPSSFHRHFKEVTALSPLQFQKQMRLQEARRQLVTESADATDVAFRVGYESISQFSREYARMFGLPPIQDMKRLKGYKG